MAKKKTIIEQNIPDEPTSNDIIDTMETTSWDTSEMDQIPGFIRAKYQTETIITKVYKVFADRNMPVFVFATGEDVTEITIQNHPMARGGKYAVRYYVDNKLIHTHYVECTDPAPTEKPNNNNSAADVQIAMLREQSQMNRDLLMAVLGRGQNTSPMSEIANMWGIMSNTLGGKGGGGGIESLIQIFKMGIELGTGRGEGGDWKSTLISSVKDIVPSIAQLAQTAMISRNGGVVVPNGNGHVQPTQMQPVQPTTPEQANAQLEEYIKQSFAMLKPRILSGMDVNVALDWITNNATDPQYAPLIEYVMAKSLDDLVKLDSDLGNEPYKTWITKLQQGLHEHFKQFTDENDENNNQ